MQENILTSRILLPHPNGRAFLITIAKKKIVRTNVQNGLDINAEKTDIVLFTRRYKISRWYPPKIDSRVLTLKSHAKYLGVILYSKLLWK